MSQVEFTSVSSRGQVVIPGDLRKQLGIEAGAKLMVFSDGINLLMKPVVAPGMESFKKMIKESQQFAKKAGLKKSDLVKAIKKVRQSANSH